MLNQKKNGATTLSPLTEQSPSNVPSVSEGGSSGLENGASEPLKAPIDFEGARTYKVPTKTALGNKVISYTKPSTTIGLDEERSNKKLIADTETKKLVDEYDAQKALRGPDEKLNTANFYLENLKKTNPDEYKYTIDKQAALSEEGDPLKIQEYQADLIKKSIAIKKRVMNGKIDLVSNNINDNYKPILDDFDKTTKEAEGLATKINGIDDFINQNFQKDENGQLITTATNRKVAEDMIKQRDNLVNEFNSNKTKLDEYSNNQDLKDAITQLDDIQKEYDSAAELYKGFAEKDPNFYKGLPEVKKQIEKEQQAQFSKDVLEPIEGDMGIMEGAGRGTTSIVKSLAYGVKNLGEDKGYGFTDEFYDNVKGSMDKIDKESNVLPTGYDKPVYEDGKWNLNYLPGKLSQTIVEMAPMVIATGGIGATAGLIARGAAAKELGYTLGSFVGEHVVTASNYYDEAREAGMSEDEAQDFANKTATMQAAISMLSPDLKLLKSNKLGLDEYTKMVAQGVSKKEAARQTAKNIVNNMMKEVPQENLQTWKEIQDQNAMYESMGLNDKVKKSITNDIVETTIVSTLLTAGFGISGAKSASSMQKQAALMAASQPDIIVARAQKMLEKGTITQQQFDDVTLKMAKASEALQKIDKTLPAETKADVLPAMIEKNDLKAEKQLVDDSQHDAINEKIKIKDEEIKNIMESPSKEQIQYDDFLKGFDAEISKMSEDKPAKVEIPKSENQQQLEGLIEKDDSQKSVPIELNPQLETIQEPTEQEKVDNQIALLEKSIEDMKKNEYWQEKITAQQFGERSRAIEKEIAKLKKPVAIEQEKIAEKPAVVETPVVEEKKADIPFAETKKSEVKTEPFAVTKKVEGGHQGIIVDPKTKKETVVGTYRDEKTAGEMANQTITDKKTSKAWDSSKKETPIEKPSITDVKSDIEKRRREELNNARTDSRFETRAEEDAFQNEDSERREDINKKLKEISEAKSKQEIADINKKYDKKEALRTKRISSPFESEEGKVIVKAERDKINAKYDAELKDLESKVLEKTTTPKKETKPTIEATTEKPVEKKNEPDNSSLIDEDEETVVKDDSDTVKKMLDDLEILKQYSPNNVKMDGKTGEEIKNLATKKYQGMIERAYKAKLEGKINQSTYTLFRNDANDILGPKIAEKNREVKGQIDAIKEIIKEKLLGQGYKNVLLSAPGINPKTVADLIDLTADLVKRGVDAGHAVRKAVDVALNYVKNHPNYDDILSSEKIPESKFRKMFEAKIGQLESIVQQSTQEETPAEKPTEGKTATESENGTSQSNKETEATTTTEEKIVTENTSQSNKKPVVDEAKTETKNSEEKPDIGSGKTKVMKHFDRMTKNPEYKELVAAIDKKGMFQDETNIKKTEQYTDSVVKEYNDQDLLPDLAIELLNNDKMFHNEIQPVVMAKVADKLFSMSANEDLNSFERSELVNLAGKLATQANLTISNAAKVTSVSGRIVKSIFEDVSASEPQTKSVATQKVKEVQGQMLTKKEKTALENSDKDINDALQSEEFKQEVEKAAEEKIKNMRDKLMGEEKSTKFANFIKSLKINLKDC